MTKTFGGVRNSSPALAGSPFESANRWICRYAQISPCDETSHIPRMLSPSYQKVGKCS